MRRGRDKGFYEVLVMVMARIYRPAKSAMQSGRAKSDCWLLEFEAEHPQWREPLMGWTGSSDMRQQLSMRFGSLEEALAYVREKGVAFRVERPPQRRRPRQSYADNFRADRPVPWTH